jgi:hypothetical protein
LPADKSLALELLFELSVESQLLCKEGNLALLVIVVDFLRRIILMEVSLLSKLS